MRRPYLLYGCHSRTRIRNDACRFQKIFTRVDRKTFHCIITSNQSAICKAPANLHRASSVVVTTLSHHRVTRLGLTLLKSLVGFKERSPFFARKIQSSETSKRSRRWMSSVKCTMCTYVFRCSDVQMLQEQAEEERTALITTATITLQRAAGHQLGRVCLRAGP
jgi:hypothetical protein